MKFLIRVDADPEIGSGHFMRMVALAQMLRDQSRTVEFATTRRNSLCDAYLADDRLPVHAVPTDPGDDLSAFLALTARLRPDWVVLDGPRFDTAYQEAVRASGPRVTSVDDAGLGHFASDIVLNQNYGAEHIVYSTAPHTRRLLGLRYVLLRREFRAAAVPVRLPWKRPQHVLVTLGGTPRQELLARILDAVLAGPRVDLAVTLAVGAFDSVGPKLAEACRRAGPRVTIARHTRRMAETMAGTDAAITAAGSTMWELLAMRVPFLAVALTEAHHAFVERLVHDGICEGLPLARLDAGAVERRIHAFVDHRALHERILARTAHLIDPRRTERELAAAFDG